MAIKVKAEQEKSSNNPGMDPRTEAPSFMNIMKDFSTGAPLSAAATEYLSNIRKTLEDPALQPTITMQKLNTPPGSVVFKLKDTGVVLVFVESITGIDPSQPVSIINAEAVQEAKRINGPGFGVVTVILVDSQSYNRSAQMAVYINKILKVKTSEAIRDLTLETMASSQYGIDTDIHTVKSFCHGNSPHSVPARSDIGFVITMKKQDKPLGPTLVTNVVKDRYEPIIGVTAYVEMLQKSVLGGRPRFIPIVHITDIVSVIPDEKILPIAIATAADIFIGRGGWKNQFSIFDKDHPNIGNLIKDDQNNLWHAESAKDREDFVNECVDKPVLVIDITEGRARIPGIEKYADPRMASAIIKMYTEFLGVNIPTNIIPANIAYTEFVGIIERGSTSLDSRQVDYFTTVRYEASNPRVREFLTRYPDPTVRASLIASFSTDMKWLYVNAVAALDYSLVSSIGKAINSTLRMRTSFNSLNGIDMSFLEAQSASYADSNVSVVGQYGQQANNGWFINPNIYG